MPTLYGTSYTRRDLTARVGDIRQIGGVRLVRADDGWGNGARQALFQTGSGLEFTVALDRGMDIADARFNGIPLNWRTSVGDVHPAYHSGQGDAWVRNWGGGLLTTGGLRHVGESTRENGDVHVMHGRASNIPARTVAVHEEWRDDEFHFWVEGTVVESTPLEEHVELRRRIGTRLGARSLTVEDTVTNPAFRPEGHLFLYHINFGFPILSPDAKIVSSPRRTVPFTESAKRSNEPFDTFSPPIDAHEDTEYEVYFTPDRSGMVSAALVNPVLQGGLGIAMHYKLEEFPYYNVWKRLAKGAYVTSMEPMNAPFAVDGALLDRAALRERGLLPVLEPGASRHYAVELEVLVGRDEIDAYTRRWQAPTS